MYISVNRWLGKLSLCVFIFCFLCISSDALGFNKIEEQKKQMEILWEKYLALTVKDKEGVIAPAWPEILKLSGNYAFNRRYYHVRAVTIRDRTYNPAYFEIDRELYINEAAVCLQSKYSLVPQRGEEKSTIKETTKEFRMISQIDKIPNAFRKYETLFLVEMYRGQDVIRGVLGYRKGRFIKSKIICEFIYFPASAVDNEGKNRRLRRQYVTFYSQERRNRQVLSINYFGKSATAKEKFLKADKPEVKKPRVKKHLQKMFDIHIPIHRQNHLPRLEQT